MTNEVIISRHNKKNLDDFKAESEKMKVSRQKFQNGLEVTKHVTALDFEVLTMKVDDIKQTLPTHLAVYQIKRDDKLGTVNGVYHGIGSRKSVKADNNGLKKDNVPQKNRWANNPDKRQEILEIVFDVLTHRDLKSDISQNFWYNMKYDFSVIVSLLSFDQIRELYHMQETTVWVRGKKYKLSTAGTKFFQIVYEYVTEKGKKARKVWKYYDISAFTQTSLDNASKQWLGEETGGKTEGFDTAKVFNDYKELKKVYKKATEYAYNDVRITALLSKKVRETFESMDIPFHTPISPASLFKDYTAYHKLHSRFNKTGEGIPSYNGVVISMENIEERYENGKLTDKQLENLKNRMKQTEYMQELSYEGYFGGLFEMYYRGYFPNVTGLDYTSMYPSIMLDLPNYAKMKIEPLTGQSGDMKNVLDEAVKINKNHRKKPDNKRNRDAIYGVIKARVTISDKARISPFSQNAKVKDTTTGKTSQKIIRPIIKTGITIMTLQMYEFVTAGSYPHLEDIEIIEGVVLESNTRTDYPFEFMEKLFNERVNVIKEYGKEDKRQLVIKILINSGYGVLAETIRKEDYTFDDETDMYLLTDAYSEAGKLARPFYAMHITEWARLKIYKDIFDNDLEQEILGVATDCIFLVGDEAVDKFEHRINRTGEKILGALEVEKEGEMVVIGNGMYQFKYHNGDVVQKTTRGYNERNFMNLFENKQSESKVIPVENVRPTSWREIALSLEFSSDKQRKPETINVFNLEYKEANINMDTGRQWERNFVSIADMFQSQINSQPLKVK